MNRIILAVGFITMVTSCNSSDKTQNEEDNSSKQEIVANTDSGDIKNESIAIDTDEALIATALLAAPEESRLDCKVIGYNMKGKFVTLKEGDNQFIVLADNPNQPGFNAACYHKSLEPFMARGRELKAMGKTRSEIFDIREAEAKSGELDMGTPGAALHIYYGKEALYDPQTSKVQGAKLRYVVYLPFATAQSTGLPEMPLSSNHPWIMDPGTHKAHIMISPLPEIEE